jgi:hypothetical protein
VFADLPPLAVVNFSLWQLMSSELQDKLTERYPALKTVADRVSDRLRVHGSNPDVLRAVEQLWDAWASDVELDFPSLASLVNGLFDDIRSVSQPCADIEVFFFFSSFYAVMEVVGY